MAKERYKIKTKETLYMQLVKFAYLPFIEFVMRFNASLAITLLENATADIECNPHKYIKAKIVGIIED